MKVAISGYYGCGNFGDEAILSVLLDKLPDAVVIKPKTFDFKAIANCDVLISGGGSLLQDVTSFKSLLYYSFIIFIALLLHKKVVIFAQGIGPLNSPLSRFIVRNLLKHCDLVTVRDEKSRQLLADWKIDSRLVCDPVYSFNIEPQEKNGTVGVQLRSFDGVDDKFLHRLAGAILRNFPDERIEIFSLQDSRDLEVCRKLALLLPSSHVVAAMDIKETIRRISQLEYMVAMRFHAVLAAIKSGVKTLAIDYDIKVRNIAQAYDLPVISLDGKGFDGQFAKLKTQPPKQVCEVFDWDVFKGIIET